MRARAFYTVAVAYAAGLTAALVTAWLVPSENPITIALWADVVATCVVFGFSVAYDNSSFYDPYWSVAPVPIAIYWMLAPEFAGVPVLRQLLVLGFVSAWAMRLTWNWARSWGGLDHEDWRYVNMRVSSGSFYWPVSFAGIHMLPTLFVFAGCLALWPALAVGTQPVGVLDLVAAVVTGGAILLEATADRQLLRFRRT